MTMIRKVMPAQILALGEDEVEVILSTAALARDGNVLVPAGCRLQNYRANPIWLWQHDPDHPVANAQEIEVQDDCIRARVKFAPTGISKKADETRGLVKAGIVRGVSVGFDPIDGEPLDPKKPMGGQRFTSWELLECSFVSVPADTGAVVTARAEGSSDWKVGASRELAIEDSDEWDGPAAEKSIFDHAGGENFSPAKARKGFLVYDAVKPKERGSYKLPIAHVVDGELKVPKGAIRAAASRLPQTDIPQTVKDEAAKVLDHYKEKAGMSKESDKGRALAVARTRMLVLDPGKPKLRGLMNVARLACSLDDLGYLKDCVAWEAEIEGDDSPVPAMIGEGLKMLGDALIAMTAEEVAEMLSHGEDDETSETVITVETRDMTETQRAFVVAGKNTRARMWRLGLAMARAGRTLSASTKKGIEDASGHAERAMKHHKAMGEAHEAVGTQLADARGVIGKAQKAHGDVGEALTAAKDEPNKAAEHVARALKAHKAVGTELEGAAEAGATMADRHEDVGDSHRAMARSMKSWQRCMRAVLDRAAGTVEDTDPDLVQKSQGDVEDKGSRSLDFRRRQATLLELASPETLTTH